MYKTKTFPHDLMWKLANTDYGEVKLTGAWNDNLNDCNPDELFFVLVNEHYDSGRWRSSHDLVFLEKSTGKHYHTRYERGLTESQHYSPFDSEEWIDCEEVLVESVVRTITETTWKYA